MPNETIKLGVVKVELEFVCYDIDGRSCYRGYVPVGYDVPVNTPYITESGLVVIRSYCNNWRTLGEWEK